MVLATAHVNLEAWLHTVAGTSPSVVISYVKSPVDGDVHYVLTVTKSGPSGTSTVDQSGNVRVRAGEPAALSRFSVNAGLRDTCRVDLTLSVNQQAATSHRFECPR